MVTIASNANLIQGCKPAYEGSTVSHFQFADNTIIFCEASEEQIKNVKAILLRYEAIGLKVNFKSELLGMRVEDQLNIRFTDILGHKVGSFPTT